MKSAEDIVANKETAIAELVKTEAADKKPTAVEMNNKESVIAELLNVEGANEEDQANKKVVTLENITLLEEAKTENLEMPVDKKVAEEKLTKNEKAKRKRLMKMLKKGKI